MPSGTFSGSTWKHFAVVRSGNSIKCFVDGTETSYSNATNTTFFSDGSPSTGTDQGGRTSVAVADNWYNSDYNFRLSYMDEFRLSTSALYTGNFSAPTAAFTS
jgi:hypothetical protein